MQPQRIICILNLTLHRSFVAPTSIHTTVWPKLTHHQRPSPGVRIRLRLGFPTHLRFISTHTHSLWLNSAQLLHGLWLQQASLAASKSPNFTASHHSHYLGVQVVVVVGCWLYQRTCVHVWVCFVSILHAWLFLTVAGMGRLYCGHVHDSFVYPASNRSCNSYRSESGASAGKNNSMEVDVHSGMILASWKMHIIIDVFLLLITNNFFSPFVTDPVNQRRMPTVCKRWNARSIATRTSFRTSTNG